ncbi:MAG: hypothetical protein HOV94_18170 [Saccharothrix sp.]|nr:hypothetical protein [Saccharothrix sp.]
MRTPKISRSVRPASRWSVALAAVLAVAATLSTSPAAQAADSTTCLGGSTIAYQPGITYTPRAVHYQETDTFSSCASTNPAVTSGTSSTGIDLPSASCLAAPLPVNEPAYTITWNNAQQSVVDLTFTDLVVGGTEQVTGTGTVTSGLFQGGNATIVWLYPVLNPLQCATSEGVTTQTGTVTIQITSL